MAKAGVPLMGMLDDLLARVDVVVDCTPKDIGAQTRHATALPESSRSFRDENPHLVPAQKHGDQIVFCLDYLQQLSPNSGETPTFTLFLHKMYPNYVILDTSARQAVSDM
jgi:hypothetical protein